MQQARVCILHSAFLICLVLLDFSGKWTVSTLLKDTGILQSFYWKKCGGKFPSIYLLHCYPTRSFCRNYPINLKQCTIVLFVQYNKNQFSHFNHAYTDYTRTLSNVLSEVTRRLKILEHFYVDPLISSIRVSNCSPT